MSGDDRREDAPHRTTERRAFDEAAGAEPQVKGGRDPDVDPAPGLPLRAPEDIDATPPHGDKTLDG